jgi:uncharacterized phage protein (TIGR01671 family)
MREILFRGKRIDNGEWVEGCLTRYSQEMSYITVDILEQEVYQIYTETVGQYTGLLDKNGKRIFEGDKVKGKDHYNHCLPFNGTVGFKDGSFVIIGECITHYRWMDYSVEIIGNIHEGVQE